MEKAWQWGMLIIFLVISFLVLSQSAVLLYSGAGDHTANVPEYPKAPNAPLIQPTPNVNDAQIQAYEQQVKAYTNQVAAYKESVIAYNSQLEAYSSYVSTMKASKYSVYAAVVKDTLVVILDKFIAALLTYVFARVGFNAVKGLLKEKWAAENAGKN